MTQRWIKFGVRVSQHNKKDSNFSFQMSLSSHARCSRNEAEPLFVMRIIRVCEIMLRRLPVLTINYVLLINHCVYFYYVLCTCILCSHAHTPTAARTRTNTHTRRPTLTPTYILYIYIIQLLHADSISVTPPRARHPTL